MYEAINTWLKGKRDYGEGRALYEAHGTDAGLKVVFGLGESPFMRKKLVAALEALAEQHRPRERGGEMLTEAPDGLKLAGPEPVKPPALGEVIERRKRMHNDRRELHAKLRLMALEHAEKYTDADRYAVQVKLDDLNQKIEESWAVERYFEKHGTMPEAPTPVAVPVVTPTPDGLRARLVTVRTYLTPTYRKRLKPERIAAYEAERDAIERELAEKEG